MPTLAWTCQRQDVAGATFKRSPDEVGMELVGALGIQARTHKPPVGSLEGGTRDVLNRAGATLKRSLGVRLGPPAK